MAGIQEIIKKLKKDFGDSVVQTGDAEAPNLGRLPTGIFPFDLATGGGFPLGRVSIVYGPESSGKTNLVLKAIAQAQEIFPDRHAVFVDAEHAFDPGWATYLGVDVAKLTVVHPEYAEQAVDILEAFLYATDVSVVVLDSIAALTTHNEIESSAEKAAVGGASQPIGKLFRKAVVSFNRMQNQGLFVPPFIAINQIRHKIGVMYGDPETMPGGNAIKFASSLIVRTYGKNIMEKKIHAVMPVYKETSVILKKWKVAINAPTAVYRMQMIEADGHSPGHVEDWPTLRAYLTEFGYLIKDPVHKWVLFGEPHPTLTAARESLYSQPSLLRETRETLIKECLEAGGISGESSDDEQ